MDKKAKVLDLLDQILEKAEEEDRLHKIRAHQNHNSAQAIGESWIVFHLKELKKLIQE